ncbi:serine/threonine protein kinase [Nonlabens sp. Asnod2-A12]|uniref:serine/threonine protein kinase n=1 Tax=Nonlabens sp. Asnod2-A12 TaxID=3160578 RepID=UPI0038654C13
MKVKYIRNIHNESGFGIIDEVVNEDGEHFARKTFSPSFKNLDPDKILSLKRRFNREVRIQAELSAEFCIPIVYHSLDEETPWFLMPIADKVFKEEIEEAKLARRAPNGLADILNCLEYLHDLGFTHRDIKPGNILFHEESWKLADMGLITADPQLTTSFVTSDGGVFGSAPYMAPEQYTDFQHVNASADIYSFGAILHDIYVGTQRKPFAKQTGPGNIGVIIEKCTEEHVDDRFSTVSVLRAVLLEELNQPLESHQTDDTKLWKDEMLNVLEWNREKFDTFIILIERNNDFKNIMFLSIKKIFIETTKNIDSRLWERFASIYLDWVISMRFDFNYCDVLIGHIYDIYNECEIVSIKSKAVFVAANLARAHNRWYVGRFVFKMCNPQIPLNLAGRIAIELNANGVQSKQDMIRCAEMIHYNLSSYHPLIAVILSR